MMPSTSMTEHLMEPPPRSKFSGSLAAYDRRDRRSAAAPAAPSAACGPPAPDVRRVIHASVRWVTLDLLT